MSEPYQTIAEMKRRYPNEWVLMADPRIDRHSQVAGGRALFHTPDRLAMDERMCAMADEDVPFRHFACVWTGEPVYPDSWDLPELVDDEDDIRQAQ